MLPQNSCGDFCLYSTYSCKANTALFAWDPLCLWNVRSCYLTQPTNPHRKDKWDFSENVMICRSAKWEWVKPTVYRWKFSLGTFLPWKCYSNSNSSFSFCKRTTCNNHRQLVLILLEIHRAKMYILCWCKKISYFCLHCYLFCELAFVVQ